MQDDSHGNHHVQLQGSEAGTDTDERPSKRRCTTLRPHREVGLMRNVRGDNFSGFVGSASGIYFIRSVYGALRQRGPEVEVAPTPASDIVPGEDDQLPSVLPQATEHLWTPREIDPSISSRCSYPQLVELSGSYFANWHLLYPFLHAPTILGFFNELSTAPNQSPNTSCHLQMTILRSIMSVSLADQRQVESHYNLRYPAHLVFPSYDAAIDSLQDVLTKPTFILGLQAAISVQLFLISMLRLNAASRLGGLINRMALQLGLHRCPARYTSFSASEKELRQRIFWSLYAIDRFICQSMGLPLGLNDDDIDVCFPYMERHVDDAQTPLQDDKLKLLSFVARESRLRGEIIDLRNKSLHYIHKDPDQATAIAARLAQWWNDIEDFNDKDDEREMTEYCTLVLTLLKHGSIISLHRPILAASNEGVEYDAALQLCVGSARSIITILHDALKPKDKSNPLVLLWPSCTWAVWISTFILFYAANNDHLSKETAIKLADRSLYVLQHLARRGSAWPEASATAIRDLRTRLLRGTENMSANQQKDTMNRLGEPSTRDATATQNAASVSEDASRMNSDEDYGLVGTDQHMGYSQPGLGTNVPLERLQGMVPTTMVAPNPTIVENTAFNDAFSSSQVPGQDSAFSGFDTLDPFSGFDIPFWLEQDQDWDFFQDFS